MENEAQSEPSTFSRLGNELQNGDEWNILKYPRFRLSLWPRDRARWSSFNQILWLMLRFYTEEWIYPRFIWEFDFSRILIFS